VRDADAAARRRNGWSRIEVGAILDHEVIVIE